MPEIIYPIEVQPREIVGLLPPMHAVARGSTTVHAAPLMIHQTAHGEHRYPRFISLCGVKGWGDAGTAQITCRRCLRILASQEES